MMGEAGIRDWFGEQLVNVKEAIGGQGRWRGAMTIFYLLGPFFMLIERTPADVWLTLCGLAFLVRCVVRRDWHWTRFFWVRAVLVFWVWCLISASLSTLAGYSIGEAAVWIRFPLICIYKRLLAGEKSTHLDGDAYLYGSWHADHERHSFCRIHDCWSE